jgi:hypothetical protein
VSGFDSRPDVSLLARQRRQFLTKVGSLRDDVGVLTAIALRQDGTLKALLTELRAMDAQHRGLANRVRALETGAEDPE